MPETLKAFANRCRCCLEKFFNDEKISTITNFFEIQFFSFTSMEVSTKKTLVASLFLADRCPISVETLGTALEPCLRVLSRGTFKIFSLQERLD